jgi:MFS family permease
MKRFNIGQTASLVGLSIFVLGLAFGPVIAAPISEKFGRRIVYLTTFPLFALFILGSGFAKNFQTLVICRFFAGVFGSPALSIGGGTNVDIWQPLMRGRATSIFLLAPFFGPSLGM